MGADLYIKDMDRKKQYTGFEVSDKARKNGYFRDCYNDAGLFSVLSANTGKDLSWWEIDRRDDLFNGEIERNMTVEGAKILRAELEPIIKKFLELDKICCSRYELESHRYEKGREVDDSEINEYKEWAQGLLDFLDLAISKKSEIIFSI